MSRPSPSLAIFDLGNVIFDTDHEATHRLWAELTGREPEELAGQLSMDPTWQDFERGRVSDAQFHRHACAVLGVDLTYAQFVAGWNAIYSDVYDGVEEMLRLLGARLTIVALTNTNAVHCQAWVPKYARVLEGFQEVFISSDLGMRKPDREIFEHVLEATHTPPDRAIFFDDVADNVRGAAAVGIAGVLVDQPSRVREALERYGLI